MSPDPSPRLPRYWLLLFVLLAFAFWGVRPLWERDEGRYAEGARGLMTEGGWMVPMIAGQPHLTKPPMTYWLIALGLKIFGINEWGARFFLSCAFFLQILLVRELSWTWWGNRRWADWAAVVFATSGMTFASGHILTTDFFLATAETLGVLCFWKIFAGAAPPWKWHAGFWFAFSLCFVIKGPPGWMPLLPIIVFLALRARWSPIPRAVKSSLFIGIPAMLLASLAWFLILIQWNPLLFDKWVNDEIINRIFTTEHKREGHWWMYFPILFGGVCPWVFAWPQFFKGMWARLRQGWRNLDDVELFSLLWVGICLAIFSAAKSRLPLYVIPLFPPLAAWLARLHAETWVPWFQGVRARRVAFTAGLGVWGLAMLVFVCFPDWAPPHRSHRETSQRVDAWIRRQDGPVVMFTRRDTAPHSVDFYIQRSSRVIDVDDADLVEYFEGVREEGKIPLMLLKENRLEKLRKKRPWVAKRLEVVAEGPELVALTLKRE